MKTYTTKQKRNVEQLSIFVYPHEKKKIEIKASKKNRSVSNFCRDILLNSLEESEN